MTEDFGNRAVPPGGAESSATTPDQEHGVTPDDITPEPAGKVALADLQNQLCPNCTTGVLYVKRYDPDALHEKGQDLSGEHQNPSGGAYDVSCASCGFSESRKLDSTGGNDGDS